MFLLCVRVSCLCILAMCLRLLFVCPCVGLHVCQLRDRLPSIGLSARGVWSAKASDMFSSLIGRLINCSLLFVHPSVYPTVVF